MTETVQNMNRCILYPLSLIVMSNDYKVDMFLNSSNCYNIDQPTDVFTID